MPVTTRRLLALQKQPNGSRRCSSNRRRLPLQDRSNECTKDALSPQISPSIAERLAAIEASRPVVVNSDSDDSSADDGSLAARLLQEAEYDCDAESEDDADGFAEATVDDEPTLNLRCMKDVKAYFSGYWKLQPSPNFLVSFAALEEFVTMDKDEQCTAKKESWSALPAAEKNRIKSLIPGHDCTCCKPKGRSDNDVIHD